MNPPADAWKLFEVGWIWRVVSRSPIAVYYFVGNSFVILYVSLGVLYGRLVDVGSLLQLQRLRLLLCTSLLVLVSM